MAGDVGRRERVIVLPESTTMAARVPDARASLDRTGACTTHEYGERVVVVDLPVDAEAEVLAGLAGLEAGGGLAAEADTFASSTVDRLDECGSLGLAAFGLRSSEGYAEAKAHRPLAGEAWDEPGGDVLPPDPPQEVADTIEGPPSDGAADGSADVGPMAAGATSARLTGRVAVGVIIVEGPTAALKFSHAERVKVVAEVQNGLAWLGAQSGPNGITFSYDVRVIPITAKPTASDNDLPKREARFRDPALKAMGYGPGIAGAQAYVNALRTARKTNWAYCAFFTKYPVGHFAYASLGGPRLVMHYDNDGWGPDNIDRLFAHETGHIFNAPDEYASSGCHCGGQWGHFKVANGNCDPCAGSSAVPCIMKANTWAMCTYTPYHLGFPQGARYTGVYVAGTGAHGFWTNASWGPFTQKWQQWSNQGLRLVDLDVARIGTQLRYSGAFRAGSGPYGLWALADWSSFVQRWQQWSGQGMRLVDIEVTRVGNALRYSGVYTQGSGAYGLWANATWSSFVQRWQQWSGQGMRLVDLSIHMDGSTPRYSGVFRQGSGAYALWALASWADFRAKWDQWSKQGLRLVDIERTMVGNQARYSGVFQQGTGAYGLWANTSWQTFKERWEQWSSQGMRLIDVAMEPTGTEAIAAQELGGLDAMAGLSEGLLGFAGATLTTDEESGPVASGEGMAQFEVAEDEPIDGDGAGVTDDPSAERLGPLVSEMPLAALASAEPDASAAGGAGGQAFDGSAIEVAPNGGTPRASDAAGDEGHGEAVLVGPEAGGDDLPSPAGIGGVHE